MVALLTGQGDLVLEKIEPYSWSQLVSANNNRSDQRQKTSWSTFPSSQLCIPLLTLAWKTRSTYYVVSEKEGTINQSREARRITHQKRLHNYVVSSERREISRDGKNPRPGFSVHVQCKRPGDNFTNHKKRSGAVCHVLLRNQYRHSSGQYYMVPALTHNPQLEQALRNAKPLGISLMQSDIELTVVLTRAISRHYLSSTLLSTEQSSDPASCIQLQRLGRSIHRDLHNPYSPWHLSPPRSSVPGTDGIMVLEQKEQCSAVDEDLRVNWDRFAWIKFIR